MVWYYDEKLFVFFLDDWIVFKFEKLIKTKRFFSFSFQTDNFKSLVFALSLFHGVIIERRKFGPLGFNIPYEFTDGDLKICMSQLKMFIDEYSEIPFKVSR